MRGWMILVLLVACGGGGGSVDAGDGDGDGDGDGGTTVDASGADAAGYRCTPRTTGWVTERTAFEHPAAPALPDAGGTFTDPTFGTTLMRLTDAADGDDNQVAYSYWPTFNLDGTRAAVNTGALGFTLIDFDPAAFTAGSRRALPASPTGPVQFEDATWSGVDPDVLYAHTLGGRLYAYDAGDDSYTLVKDLNEALPGEYQWQMSKSIDDQVFAFTRRDSSDYSVVGWVVYQRATDTVIADPGPGGGLDEVHVDKTGRYLLVATGASGAGVVEGQVHDLQAETVEDLVDDGPDYNPGHYDLGHGNLIGNDNWTNRLTMRDLATPHEFVTALDFGSDWQLANHTSLLADDESWALVSFYGGEPPGVFRGEIIQVATDGSQQVRRLAHHRSQFGEYYDSPRANISRDGCLVAFASNWDDSGRRDVFVLDLGE